ncbi:hypothetical protein ACQPZX_30055 [Actinoplanes sp. CA-142083]|uniref:hypothetical protein n=1 Tax=Actinoplanes sp. CA-142083 TaxID=3239903 RepID=UPI003D92013F
MDLREQPASGVAGLVVVLPVALLIGFATGGAESSLRVVGPIVTFGLPAVALIAFWWDDWPGVRLPGVWAGVTDTLIAAVAAVVFTILGQAVVDRVDFGAMLNPFPGPGRTATFPATLPLAAGVFTAILQLTLVCEGWPVRKLRKIPAGLVGLALCWIVGIAGYLLVVRTHLVPGGVYGAWLTVLGVWQVVPYVALKGWPINLIADDARRRAAGNALVIGGGWVSYLVCATFLPPETITAVAGCAIAATLIVGMLLDSWLLARTKTGILVMTAAATALTYWLLDASVRSNVWHPGAGTDDWIAFAALNAVGLAVILHVAIWRRWPVSALSRTRGNTDGADGRGYAAAG